MFYCYISTVIFPAKVHSQLYLSHIFPFLTIHSLFVFIQIRLIVHVCRFYVISVWTFPLWCLYFVFQTPLLLSPPPSPFLSVIFCLSVPSSPSLFAVIWPLQLTWQPTNVLRAKVHSPQVHLFSVYIVSSKVLLYYSYIWDYISVLKSPQSTVK